MGESQHLDIDTFVLFAKPELAHISSSAVKEIQSEQGFLDAYVPIYVKQCLEERISQRYVIGLTGEIGVGKSYVGERLVDLAKDRGFAAHNIELDDISHQIQSDLKGEKYALLRKEIVETFGNEVLENGKINRKALGEIVFNDQEKLIKLNEIMHTAILLRLRKELKNLEGLVFINAALLAEAEMTTFANNNMLLLKANDKVQEKRLLERGLNKEQIKRRIDSQYNFANKKKNLENVIKEQGNGKLWIYDNSKGSDKELNKLLDQFLEYFKIQAQ
jgi:dephospho-CoA kinase